MLRTSTRSIGRVELAFLVGQSYPSVVVNEAIVTRAPPTARDAGETYNLFMQDVSARLWWTRRLSTAIGFGWSSEGFHTDVSSRQVALIRSGGRIN